MTHPQPPASAEELAVVRALLEAAWMALAAGDPAFARHAAAAITAHRHDIRAVFDPRPDGEPDPTSLRYVVLVPDRELADMVPVVTVPWRALPMTWRQVLDELADCNRHRAPEAGSDEHGQDDVS